MATILNSRRQSVAVLTVCIVMGLSIITALYGQDALPPDAIEPPAWPRSGEIYPAPEPFSLNGYDALQAMAMIRREGLLIERTGTGREIVVVDSIEAVAVDPIEDYPPQHRARWDLLLNGEPLRWDATYIEYGGRLLSVRLLFTYRNQRPVPDIPYILE